jgi:hypothetical protein
VGLVPPVRTTGVTERYPTFPYPQEHSHARSGDCDEPEVHDRGGQGHRAEREARLRPGATPPAGEEDQEREGDPEAGQPDVALRKNGAAVHLQGPEEDPHHEDRKRRSHGEARTHGARALVAAAAEAHESHEPERPQRHEGARHDEARRGLTECVEESPEHAHDGSAPGRASSAPHPEVPGPSGTRGRPHRPASASP